MRHYITLVFTTRQQSLPQKNLLKIREMKQRQLLSLHKLLPGQEDNKAFIHTQTTR
jgi:hypothetical protein